jgi:glycerol-3-phosphate acyltransferase PlsY
VLCSYLLGCCTAGYYWVRWRTGQDVRQSGSGNLGARNVGRVLGPAAFVITFLIDFAKGALALAGASFFGLDPTATIACAVAVVAGHNWPAQLRFRGGKGIATSLGALLVYDPFLMLCLGAVFLPAFVLLRSFTMSGLLAFALGPLVARLTGQDYFAVTTVALLSVLALITHRKNIREEIARMVGGPAAKDARPADERFHQ